MLRSAHFVSLHCPLTPKTRGLLGTAEFKMMRPGAMVINYARGEVIDKEVGCPSYGNSDCIIIIHHSSASLPYLLAL